MEDTLPLPPTAADYEAPLPPPPPLEHEDVARLPLRELSSTVRTNMSVVAAATARTSFAKTSRSSGGGTSGGGGTTPAAGAAMSPRGATVAGATTRRTAAGGAASGTIRRTPRPASARRVRTPTHRAAGPRRAQLFLAHGSYGTGGGPPGAVGDVALVYDPEARGHVLALRGRGTQFDLNAADLVMPVKRPTYAAEALHSSLAKPKNERTKEKAMHVATWVSTSVQAGWRLPPGSLLELTLALPLPGPAGFGTFSVDVHAADDCGSPCNFTFSTGFRRLSTHGLHIQVPLAGAPHGRWMRLQLDMEALRTAAAVAAASARTFVLNRPVATVHRIIVHAPCKLRAIATVRPPAPSAGLLGGDDSGVGVTGIGGGFGGGGSSGYSSSGGRSGSSRLEVTSATLADGTSDGDDDGRDPEVRVERFGGSPLAAGGAGVWSTTTRQPATPDPHPHTSPGAASTRFSPSSTSGSVVDHLPVARLEVVLVEVSRTGVVTSGHGAAAAAGRGPAATSVVSARIVLDEPGASGLLSPTASFIASPRAASSAEVGVPNRYTLPVATLPAVAHGVGLASVDDSATTAATNYNDDDDDVEGVVKHSAATVATIAAARSSLHGGTHAPARTSATGSTVTWRAAEPPPPPPPPPPPSPPPSLLASDDVGTAPNPWGTSRSWAAATVAAPLRSLLRGGGGGGGGGGVDGGGGGGGDVTAVSSSLVDALNGITHDGFPPSAAVPPCNAPAGAAAALSSVSPVPILDDIDSNEGSELHDDDEDDGGSATPLPPHPPTLPPAPVAALTLPLTRPPAAAAVVAARADAASNASDVALTPSTETAPGSRECQATEHGTDRIDTRRSARRGTSRERAPRPPVSSAASQTRAPRHPRVLRVHDRAVQTDDDDGHDDCDSDGGGSDSDASSRGSVREDEDTRVSRVRHPTRHRAPRPSRRGPSPSTADSPPTPAAPPAPAPAPAPAAPVSATTFTLQIVPGPPLRRSAPLAAAAAAAAGVAATPARDGAGWLATVMQRLATAGAAQDNACALLSTSLAAVPYLPR